jgi:hypothetical protein
MRPGGWSGLLVAILLTFVSCASAPASRPEDFALEVRYVSGSMPPPHHIEWNLSVGADGHGRFDYRPDYQSSNPPVFTEEFAAAPSQLDALYVRLREAGVLQDIPMGSNPPVGGDQLSGTFTASGQRYDVDSFDQRGGSPLRPVLEDLRALMPAGGWERIEQQRARYAEQRYPDR